MIYPSWLDRNEYPFQSHYFELPCGRIHYIDEGKGETIIFLHGNPSWSFDYRNIIKKMRQSHRCIAIDYIGFGLSDKPYDWDYLPQSQAFNFETFVNSINLPSFTLVVNDWGGPIGLSYAIQYPHKINRIVISNSWLWPVNGDFHFEAFSKIMGGPIGRFLSRNYNFFARIIGKAVFGNRKNLDHHIFKHYYAHLENKRDRKGTWVFPKHITASSDWLQELWERREILKTKPILLLWGMKDPGFREKELNTWTHALPKAKVVKFDHAGHFPQEEASETFWQQLEIFMKK